MTSTSLALIRLRSSAVAPRAVVGKAESRGSRVVRTADLARQGNGRCIVKPSSRPSLLWDPQTRTRTQMRTSVPTRGSMSPEAGGAE